MPEQNAWETKDGEAAIAVLEKAGALGVLHTFRHICAGVDFGVPGEEEDPVRHCILRDAARVFMQKHGYCYGAMMHHGKLQFFYDTNGPLYDWFATEDERDVAAVLAAKEKT